MDLQIQEVAWHRNGIGGVGFYAIRFLWQPEDELNNGKPERFLAILFDEPGECAVIGLDRIESAGIEFAGGNSWRGDRFEDELRQAVEEHDSSGSVRIGPFGLPTDMRHTTE